LARPGGTITGFVPSEFSFAGKWLELLEKVAPRVTRVVPRNPAVVSQIGLDLETDGSRRSGEERSLAGSQISDLAGMPKATRHSAVLNSPSKGLGAISPKAGALCSL
jgi:hypothetical protein